VADVPLGPRPVRLARPLRPSDREWLRWVRAWARRLGHAWSRDAGGTFCSLCGARALVLEDRRPGSPSSYREFVLSRLEDCQLRRVRQVHES